jgi:hypothetical protein
MTMEKPNFSIDTERMERLRTHCKKTGVKMSEAVRQGLDLLFLRELRMDEIKRKNGIDKNT